MSENKKYYSNFFTLLSGNTIGQIVPFLVAPILARLFLPSEFAVYGSFLAIASLFGIVAAGRLEMAIPLPEADSKASRIFATATRFTIVVSVLSIVVYLFNQPIADFYDSNALKNHLSLVPIAVFSIGFLGILNYWTLRKGRYFALSTNKIIQAIVTNALGLVLGYLGWGADGLIWGWIIGQFIAILVLLSNNRFRYNDFRISFVDLKQTIRDYKDFPLINSLHAFTDVFATQVVLFWLISFYFGFTELGLFIMMVKYIKAPIVLITSSVSQLFYKEASEGIAENKNVVPLFFRTLKTSIFFALPFLALILLFGPSLFEIYLGSNWKEAGWYAVYFSPVFFMLFISSPVSGVPLLMNKQKEAFLLAVVNYTLSLTALFSCIALGWSVKESLLIYSGLNSIFNGIVLIWYYRLLSNC